MKKAKLMTVAAAAAFLLSSCGAWVASPVMGGLYTDVQSPVAVTSNSGSSKVGSSEAVSYLGLVATGDASIDAAAKKAGITKIHHVDAKSTNILGLFAKYTIYVYGE